jgi:hypothetical protein
MGLAAAVAWSMEIWVGGPAKLDRPVEQALGATFALLAVAVTVAAGIVAGLRTRSPRAAMRAGLFAGLVSGVTVFCFAVVMTLTNLTVLASRDDCRHQFAASHSHPPDMATFLVGDILATGIAHLVINLVLGLIGGGLGAFAAAMLNRTDSARDPPPSDDTASVTRPGLQVTCSAGLGAGRVVDNSSRPVAHTTVAMTQARR